MIPGLSSPIPGFSPDFFKQAPAAERPSEGVSFPMSEGQSLSEFLESPEFKQFFEQEFRSHVNDIKAFAWLHLSETSAENVCTAFQQLADRLFDSEYDFFGSDKYTLYGDGKRSLQAFAAQLSNPEIDLTVRQNCIMELAFGIQQCAPGAAGNLQNAVKLFDLALGSPFLRAKEEVVMESINAVYLHLTAHGNPIEIKIGGKNRIVESIPVAYEVHVVTSLRNALAESLGLSRVIDPTADAYEFPPESIAYCGRNVARNLSPARLALNLAEEYLDAIRQAVFTLFGEKAANGEHDPHQIFDYAQIREAVSQIEEERKGYGDINFESVFTPLDENAAEVRIKTDPTLIALNILARQRSNGFLAQEYVPETVAHWRHGGKNTSIRHIEGLMAWALEDSKPQPLTPTHLMPIFPKDFRGREHIPKLIAATVVRNTPPGMLRAGLTLDWLSITDATQVFSKWTRNELTRYLTRNRVKMMQLPRFRRLSIAKGIVACGSPSDLDLCIQNGYMMFEPPLTQVHPPAFFGIALQRGDPVMLNKLLNLFEDGWNKSERIKAHAPGILAAADEDGRPALAEALLQRRPNPTLFHYYKILTHAAIDGMIGGNELEELLAGKDKWKVPAVGYAIKDNVTEHIGAFYTALIDAGELGLIDTEQVCSLLSASAHDIPAFFVAMGEGFADIVRIFGAAIVTAHGKEIICRDRVFDLLSATPGDDWTALQAAIVDGREEAVIAYCDVLTLAIRHGALTCEQGHRILGTAASILKDMQEETMDEGVRAAAHAFIEFMAAYADENSHL